VLKVRYLDYAGGRLTDAAVGGNTEESNAFFGRLAQADALLGILDGRKILALLQDEPDGADLLNFEMTTPLGIMQRSPAPVQFVITKWDLLQERYTLADVRERLLENRPLRNLVESRSRFGSGRIRLIPVSAVGFDYVDPQPDGTMVKRAGQAPEPWQVDIPLAAVIPDQLALVQESLDKRTRELLASKPDAVASLRLADRLALRAAQALHAYAPAVRRALQRVDPGLAARLSEDDVHRMARMVDRRARQALVRTEWELRAERDRSLAGVRDELSALDHLNASFADRLEGFEREFPDSLLSLAPVAEGA
jgi:hypothetical protein